MLDSVRTRLTLWYTGVLALALVGFAIIAYLFLAQLLTERTNTALIEATDAFAMSLTLEQSDGESFDDAAREATREFRFHDFRFFIFDVNGGLIAASDDASGSQRVDESAKNLPVPAQIPRALIAAAAHTGAKLETLVARESRVGLYARTVNVGDQMRIVVAARSLVDRDETLEAVLRALLSGVALALLLASLGGYFLARKSLAPVVSMSEKAAHISAASLHERLPIVNERDELGRLARVFNDLLARLAESFEQQRRFMADASHELRTPLSIVRGEAEVALSQQERSVDDYRESLAIVHDEGRRLTRIVEDLFTLARADAGQYKLIKTDFYLDELAMEVTRSVRTLAAERNLWLQIDAPIEMPFHADESLLRRLLLNLLDNAIKNTPCGGTIKVACEMRDGEYLLTVSDTGAGIPSEAQRQIFERFYRADKARSRHSSRSSSNAAEANNSANLTSGVGLGLSIARWIAEAHDGTLELQSSDAAGSVFVAKFPAPPRR